MSGSTINITFKLDGDNNGFKQLAKDADGLKKALSQTLSEAQQLKGNVINFAALTTGFNAISNSVQQLHGMFNGLSEAYAVQVSAETRLETVMKQRMNATDAQIQSIKDLASAQQGLGIVGDEVQLSGAQQMATFLNEKSSLDTLIPAMNNLVAQQKGYNATAQDAVNIGNLIGKAMQGQTSALRRVGITFDEAEEKVLKFGTEEEKAAMLAQVITNNVGLMNEAMAQTDPGKLQQTLNTLGDYKEVFGGYVKDVQPYLAMAAQATTAVSGIGALVAGIKTLSAAMSTNIKTFALSTAAFIKNKAAMLATAVASKAVAAATTLWTGAQKLLNMVLTMNPIGMVITAVGALTAGVIYAYNHFEGFRKICLKVWEVIEPLAQAIMNGLNRALSWLVEKAQQAWTWLKNLLGLNGEKVEVTATVKKAKSAEIVELENKYAGYKDTGGSGTMGSGRGMQKVNAVYKENAEMLKDIMANISILEQKRQNANAAEAADINRLISFWKAKEDAILEAGKAADASADAVDDNTGATEKNVAAFKENASTLRDIEGNISILREKMMDASVAEAAGLNREIDLWNKKADAIRNAGKESGKESVSMGKALRNGWASTKRLTDGIDDMKASLTASGSVWQRVTGIVDGFIGLYEGMTAVKGAIQMLTGVSTAHAVAKGAEGAAEVSASGARAGATDADVVASGEMIAANKQEAASFRELAASKYMDAHASIPFLGFGIGAGFVASMMALVRSAGLPMLAKGGIASGPTLAMVGEYAGAHNNPEVIAPLDKLRDMIGGERGSGGDVRFKIEGRDLVGVLNKVGSKNTRY